jgi:hypothetical protein
MCFSASASFSLAAATAVVGVATLYQVQRPREIALAAVPLLFALQQAVEGLLWLELSGAADRAAIAALAFAFLLFAEVLWPVYAVLAVLLVEPDHRRRAILCAVVAAGAALSLYLLSGLLSEPPAAIVRGHSIAYSRHAGVFSWQQAAYVIITVGGPVVSSHRIIRLFGVAVAIGFAITAYAYAATLISVWCFFAAASSSLLYWHFRGAARQARLRPGGKHSGGHI